MALIRKAGVEDSAGIARVHVDCWRTSYRGIVPDQHLAALTYETYKERWQRFIALTDDRADYVAVSEEGNIMGFASSARSKQQRDGTNCELMAIYILESYQRRGIGRRLLSAVCERMWYLGYRTISLWVLKDNPGRQFYERLGGQLAGSKHVSIGGRLLCEVQYTWEDMSGLIMKG